MKVAFLGRGDTGLTILRSVIDRGYDVPFVWTCEHTPEVGGHPDTFKQIAAEHGIPFDYIHDINTPENTARLREHDPDIAVAIFWMDRVSEEVLSTVDHGFLNLHGGDLPRYRGNAAANWAILEGESEMGVTVHRMVSELDAGPILAQEQVPIDQDTTVADLVSATREVGCRLVLQVLESYRAGQSISPRPQEETRALRCYPRLPEYGRIDWTESAHQIDRLVRSLGGPYPPAFTYHGLDRVEVLDVDLRHPGHDYLAEPGHIIHTVEDGEVWVATGDGVLAIELVRLEDEEEPIAPGREFRSIRDCFGVDVAQTLRRLERRIEALEAGPHDTSPDPSGRD